MERSTDRVLTTHTGSLPRPKELAEALMLRDRGELSGEGAEAFPGLVREAVAGIVRRQAGAGIDVVSDGEMSKFGYATYVKERLTGFEGPPEPLALADLADYPDFTMRVPLEVTNPSCTGPVTFRGAGAVQEDGGNLTAATRATAVEGAFLNAASPGIISEYMANNTVPVY